MSTSWLIDVAGVAHHAVGEGAVLTVAEPAGPDAEALIEAGAFVLPRDHRHELGDLGWRERALDAGAQVVVNLGRHSGQRLGEVEYQALVLGEG